MIVCVCNRVSDRDINRLVSEGVSSFEELQLATGAATCCGRCESCARDTFEQAQHLHGRIHAQLHLDTVHPLPAPSIPLVPVVARPGHREVAEASLATA